MKQKAYTLAEVLISIGIIGVLAAIMLPLANKYKPDSNKVLYLKTYDAVVETVQSLATDYSAYPIAANGYNYDNAPFYNKNAFSLNGVSIGGTNAKLCQLLYVSLNTTGGESCSASWQEYSDSSFKPDFTSTGNVEFMVTSRTNPNYQTNIYFDVNGRKGKNCIYNADTCKEPDRFKLMVAANGAVIAADPVGEQYLSTRSNLKKDSSPNINGAILETLPEELAELRPKSL